MPATSDSGSARLRAVTRVASLVRTLLTDLGEDVSRDGLLDTPQRVAKAHMDAMAGYSSSSSSVIGEAIFHEPLASWGCGGTVLVRDIDFASTCEKTLMPFHGRCHVAYLPADESVLGLSKLARLVQAYSKRLCTQHGLTRAIEEAVTSHVRCTGVFVQIQARHLASVVDGSVQLTEAFSGCYLESGSLHTKEARMLLSLGQQDIPSSADNVQEHSPGTQAGTSTVGGPVSWHSSPDTGPCTPPSCVHSTVYHPMVDSDVHHRMVETVREMYSLILEASGQNFRIPPAAAAAYVNILLRQTAGYMSRLQEVSTRHSCLACRETEQPLAPFCSVGGATDTAQAVSPSVSPSSECCAADAHGDHLRIHAQLLEEKFLEDSAEHETVQDCATCTASEVATGASMCTGSESVRAESESDSMCSAGVGGAIGGVVMGVPVPTAGCKCCAGAHGHSLSSNASECTGVAEPALHSWQKHLEGRAQTCTIRFPTPDVQVQCSTPEVTQPALSTPRSAVSTAQLWSVKFATQCEHHMLPFYGVMHFALVREGSVAPSLSAACVRDIVELYSCRLQVQERLAQQVATALHEKAGGDGVVLVCSAAHMCMVARGVERHAAETLSTAARGQLEQDAEERSIWLQRVLECVQKQGFQ